MRYFGGKSKISRPLTDFLNTKLKHNQPFIDLFCGSCNIISKIEPNRIRIANDIHAELIALWLHLQNDGFLPDIITRDEYYRIKETGDDWLKAFAGFGCSFAGKYFGGYAENDGKNNYCLQSKNSIIKKSTTLGNTIFTNLPYHDVDIPEHSFIYCDIPYKNSTGYRNKFCHNTFYEWAITKSKTNDIYISEYLENVPSEFEIVWCYSGRKDIRDKEGIQQKTTEVLMKPRN